MCKHVTLRPQAGAWLEREGRQRLSGLAGEITHLTPPLRRTVFWAQAKDWRIRQVPHSLPLVSLHTFWSGQTDSEQTNEIGILRVRSTVNAMKQGDMVELGVLLWSG